MNVNGHVRYSRVVVQRKFEKGLLGLKWADNYIQNFQRKIFEKLLFAQRSRRASCLGSELLCALQLFHGVCPKYYMSSQLGTLESLLDSIRCSRNEA